MFSAKKTALITGGATRIGHEIVLFLAKLGWDIAIHYNTSEEGAEALAQKLLPRKAQIFSANFTDPDQVEQLIPAIYKTMGPISLLVNNAAYFANDTLATLSEGHLNKHMQVNIHAPALLMQNFAVHAPNGSNIINMVDYCVCKLPNKFLSYTLSKSALWTLTQMAASELAPNIRVNAIGPGFALKGEHMDPIKYARSEQDSPLGHSTSPDEICRTIGYIIDTKSITGQLLLLAGGRHLSNHEFYTADAI